MADAAIERAFAGAKNLIGRLFAVGGSSWAVSRLSGDGLASAKTAASAGTVGGWLTQGTAQPGASQPGEPAPPARWSFTRTGGAALTPGDVLTSGSVTIRIGTLLDSLGYEEWEATRL
jgi:hypothetical protein